MGGSKGVAPTISSRKESFLVTTWCHWFTTKRCNRCSVTLSSRLRKTSQTQILNTWEPPVLTQISGFLPSRQNCRKGILRCRLHRLNRKRVKLHRTLKCKRLTRTFLWSCSWRSLDTTGSLPTQALTQWTIQSSRIRQRHRKRMGSPTSCNTITWDLDHVPSTWAWWIPPLRIFSSGRSEWKRGNGLLYQCKLKAFWLRIVMTS